MSGLKRIRCKRDTTLQDHSLKENNKNEILTHLSKIRKTTPSEQYKNYRWGRANKFKLRKQENSNCLTKH